MVVDEVARRFGVESWRQKDQARQALDRERGIVLVEPTSFMNLSGVPVRLISSWYKSPPESVLVVSDDMDLPFGRLRMRGFGGHGGHNGLRSIIGTIGDSFPRLRIGVGRPSEGESIDYVLGEFAHSQREQLQNVISVAVDSIEIWLGDGLAAAMQAANTALVD